MVTRAVAESELVLRATTTIAIIVSERHHGRWSKRRGPPTRHPAAVGCCGLRSEAIVQAESEVGGSDIAGWWGPSPGQSPAQRIPCRGRHLLQCACGRETTNGALSRKVIAVGHCPKNT